MGQRNVQEICFWRKENWFSDQQSLHPSTNWELKSIKLFFLPPKTTSQIQPIDQGVIGSLKHITVRMLYVRLSVVLTRRKLSQTFPLHEEYTYPELFWSTFPGIRENADQNNYEYRHFLRSVLLLGMQMLFAAWDAVRTKTVVKSCWKSKILIERSRR